ncbi:hypothetical protein [Paenibacillus koleovorans]|uniref:hypothetical protein n=1 Tax=Paenibacillus koleovorans TaxID=121608 RepID=UPI000FD90065|nr:hypothetical protein [Paenibacillus koleovorans]
MLTIDVWYGCERSFGRQGIPQDAINILGNVRPARYVAELFYTLDGDFPVKLSLGPDRRRLSRPGDFNVEIVTEGLSEGTHTLRLEAVDVSGGIAISEVIFHYGGERRRSPELEIDWRDVARIDDAAQVIDGLWGLADGCVRTLAPGYDRVIGVGDIAWSDYEVTVPVTIHGFDIKGVNPIGYGYNVGIVLRWQGHADWDGRQPRYGYYPYGALALYEYNFGRDPHHFHLRLYGNNVQPLNEQQCVIRLELGVPYIFKAFVRSCPNETAHYGIKVWQSDQTEPANWALEGRGFIGERTEGAVLLLAHHTDASFGNVKIRPC